MGKALTTKSDLSVGDIVIVHSESLPRGLWKMGTVSDSKTVPGCHYNLCSNHIFVLTD